jgi:N-methylhydantoinase A
MTISPQIRLGADIGGTFTDVVLEVGDTMFSAKVLTNYARPDQAILDGIKIVTEKAKISPCQIDLVIHGTTLATNALIERRGARTAFVTTEGFRDVIEMRTENRFEQYDLDITLPSPLVPREDRFTVKGRFNAVGKELQPLCVNALENIAERIAIGDFGAVAIGFIHSYVNPDHELRARHIIARKVDLPISISSEVSPQMREFERFNTVCANAYVRPQISQYLNRLQMRLKEIGIVGEVVVIHSGGGLISIATAAEFPVRLVESGPAGGAIFARNIAQTFGLESIVSYDMGGTTAKICLINDFHPRTARTFEVARTYRFCKGSGIPISIPVVEMIEIGAGGGSVAWIDAMNRIQIGPQSVGSEPGPACYQRGGTRSSITDADLVLAKLDPDNFAGGTIKLSMDKAKAAIEADVGKPLRLDPHAAAFGITEVVDENMANAARVHAVENGDNISDKVMIAFGGAAPLHAARLCEKLGIDMCLVPVGAGVGSAIGFLKAPFSYESIASRLMQLSAFDACVANKLVSDLNAISEAFVRIVTDGKLHSEVTAFMRYAGQGWEIPVPMVERPFDAASVTLIRCAFEASYARFFGRAIDSMNGLEIEIVTWSVTVRGEQPPSTSLPLLRQGERKITHHTRAIFDPARGLPLQNDIFRREDLTPGCKIVGPAIVVEQETTTVITSPFDAIIQVDGSILLTRKGDS